MRLAYGRHTAVMLVAALFLTLGLIVGLFVVDVEPVQAENCGTWYLYSGQCNNRVAVVYDPQGPCMPSWPAYYHVTSHTYERYMNPDSHKKTGQFTWTTCNWPGEGCPAYCN